MQDLRWIAPTLNMCIRLTIGGDAWANMSAIYPWVQQDMLFGSGPVATHLLFNWCEAASEKRRFKHYDLLVPTKKQLFSMLLLPDFFLFSITLSFPTSAYIYT